MEERISLKEAIINGLKQSLKVILKIIKILIPVYIIVQLLDYYEVLDLISVYLEPIMRWFGLPGSAAIVLLLSNGINIYAGIGALGAMTLTTKQITILALMVTTSHSLIIETSILKAIQIPRWLQLLLRIGMMVVLGLILNALWRE
ncbi:MAG: nucleoside recognition domain-containing protein [Bacilli bacterium]